MKFSIVIPTMWRGIEYLLKMLPKYEESVFVEEVLLINNKQGFPLNSVTQFSKVRVIGNGINKFVNPSWDYGVKNAKCANVIIINDDIIIEKFPEVMELIIGTLAVGNVIGFDKNCFENKRECDLFKHIKISKTNEKTVTYGFGTFMAVKKQSYMPVGEPMLVWYGDTYLFAQLEPFLIEGINVVTPMALTARPMKLYKQKKIEMKYCANNAHKFCKL